MFTFATTLCYACKYSCCSVDHSFLMSECWVIGECCCLSLKISSNSVTTITSIYFTRVSPGMPLIVLFESSAGFNAFDQPLPRAINDLAFNHGGIVFVIDYNIALSPITIANQTTTAYQVFCICTFVRCFTTIVVYLPGLLSMLLQLMDESAVTLYRFCQKPIYIVDDFNIRLHLFDDVHDDQFCRLIDFYGMKLHAPEVTHQLGRTLDAVFTHEITGCPGCAAVEDDVLTNYHVLRWVVSTTIVTSSVMNVLGTTWICI